MKKLSEKQKVVANAMAKVLESFDWGIDYEPASDTCEECGNELEVDHNFCPICGKKANTKPIYSNNSIKELYLAYLAGKEAEEKYNKMNIPKPPSELR